MCKHLNDISNGNIDYTDHYLNPERNEIMYHCELEKRFSNEKIKFCVDGFRIQILKLTRAATGTYSYNILLIEYIPIIVIPLYDSRVILTSETSIQITTYKDYHILFDDYEKLEECKICIDNGRRIAQDLSNLTLSEGFTVWKPDIKQVKPKPIKETIKENIDFHKCKITLYSWGDNRFGQLGCPGQGISDYSPFPVEVPYITNIVYINSGSNHAALVNNDGKVYIWGDNRYGQLGIFDHGPQSIQRPTIVYYYYLIIRFQIYKI